MAYGLQPLLDRGTDGRGQTVVLMEFANTPQQPAPQVTDIRQDMALFDAVFGLPAAQLQVNTSLAGSSWPWLADPALVAAAAGRFPSPWLFPAAA